MTTPQEAFSELDAQDMVISDLRDQLHTETGIRIKLYEALVDTIPVGETVEVTDFYGRTVTITCRHIRGFPEPELVINRGDHPKKEQLHFGDDVSHEKIRRRKN